MSYINDIVIPGDKGRVFTTSIDKTDDLNRLKEVLNTIQGVESVDVNTAVFPTEIRIVADTVVEVKEVEEAANNLGYHLIPKSIFS